jgi:hypothetical protein
MGPTPVILTALLVLAPCARAQEDAVSVDWGQGKPEVLSGVYGKVSDGAKKEKWARNSRGVFAKVFGMQPDIEAKLIPVDDYLPDDSPASAGKGADGGQVIRVGRAALDACQSEAEMAFLLGHELHHTLVRERKFECYKRGYALYNRSKERLMASPEAKRYTVDLEHEADSWGQRYMTDAGYNPLTAVDAMRHIKNLGEALGADASKDEDHAAFAVRESQLQAAGRDAPYEAPCPWPEQ